MKKAGIIRCQQTEDMCPGNTDFKVDKEGKLAFEETGPVEIVGFVSCGGCPGKRAIARAQLMVDRGAQIIVFASCISKGNPIGYPCPHYANMRDAIIEKIGPDIQVLEYTHEEVLMNPLFKNKYYDESSLFTAEGLLREARRQKTIKTGNVPKLCLLDPDGDLFRYLKNNGAKHNPYWACYHSEMVEMSIAGQTVGVVGCAVGSSYAVLVAEQLFASGCGLLISITSAGQILPVAEPPYFVLINKALRDEGTSYHYLPPQPYVDISPDMLEFYSCLESGHPQVIQGGVWTTDAPFRETKQAINYARSEGLLAVEMEAAALYAFAEAKNKSVICFAYVTNQMATVDNDFEKGDANGNKAMYNLLEKLVRAWEDTK